MSKRVSPSSRGASHCFNANATANDKHTEPTTIYATPKNEFFPPNQLVVLITIHFFPLKSFTKKLFSIENVTDSPFVNVVCVMRPYSFLKRGSPAVLIQTIKCSFFTPSKGDTTIGNVSYKYC